mmetsp:Transcript_22749/g.39261  ORF Transcript_22749/g.39261 Transcript_22749/m.39261 type:complete len:328 (-) Transcript_22749:169-1152(-)
MSISFESAVETLKVMFPDWDEETLSTILVSNNYHVENTIETVLSMGETNGDEKPVSRPTSPPTTRPGGAVGAPPPSRPQETSGPTASQGNPFGAAPSSSSGRNRGLRCDLPADFLRPPSWQPNTHTILADEELALMLQDEMFQEQVRQALGENYLNETMGPNGTRRTVPASGNARNQPAAGNTQPQPDMGILKALNSMGSAAKRNLSNLAQGFSSSSSNNNASNTSRGGFGGGSPPPAGGAVRRGSGSGSGSRRKKGQFDDLDDDEEGTEIITFSGTEGGSRSRHMLQNDGARAANQDEDEDLDGVNDSENPLLQYKSTNNVNINKK